MREPRYPAVLFDLDGTLTDPFVGIVRSVAYALERVGHAFPGEEALRAWVGPPLQASFRAYLGDPAQAARAVAAYRERYGSVGMYENTPYPGIAELLGTLRSAGTRLFVATSKLRGPAEGILAHFGLADFFEAVSAPEPGEGAHKAEVIAAILPRLGAHRAHAVMVGDTVYDVEGARANELPCIAVGYGFGTHESLEQARPLAIAHSVEELWPMLLA